MKIHREELQKYNQNHIRYMIETNKVNWKVLSIGMYCLWSKKSIKENKIELQLFKNKAQGKFQKMFGVSQDF